MKEVAMEGVVNNVNNDNLTTPTEHKAPDTSGDGGVVRVPASLLAWGHGMEEEVVSEEGEGFERKEGLPEHELEPEDEKEEVEGEKPRARRIRKGLTVKVRLANQRTLVLFYKFVQTLQKSKFVTMVQQIHRSLAVAWQTPSGHTHTHTHTHIPTYAYAHTHKHAYNHPIVCKCNRCKAARRSRSTKRPGQIDPGEAHPCYDFSIGRCVRGESCKFSHAYPDHQFQNSRRKGKNKPSKRARKRRKRQKESRPSAEFDRGSLDRMRRLGVTSA